MVVKKLKPSVFFAMAWILEEIQLYAHWLRLVATVAVSTFRIIYYPIIRRSIV